MKRKNISSGSPFEGEVGFSRAVRIGNYIAVSGTAPILPDGTTAFIGDMYKQTKYCLEIIEKAIKEAGGTLENTIRTRVYINDASDYVEAAAAHGEYFGEIKPACTFVEANLLSLDWMVEIEVDCIVE